MPFLRRRGNMANEADMRHHHGHAGSSSSNSRSKPNSSSNNSAATTTSTTSTTSKTTAATVTATPSSAAPSTTTNTSSATSSSSKDRVSSDQPPKPPPKPQSQSLPAPLDDTEAPLSQHESRDSVKSRPSTPPAHQQSTKNRRFSILRFRNASDSQLALKVKQQAEKPPPVPSTPAIITTAPSNDPNQAGPKKMSSRMGLAARFRRSVDIPRDEHQQQLQQLQQHQQSQQQSLQQSQLQGHHPHHQYEQQQQRQHVQGPPHQQQSLSSEIPTVQEVPDRQSIAEEHVGPPFSASDEPHSPRPSTQATTASNGTGLGVSANRPSDSSRSDVSVTDPVIQSSPNASIKKSRPTTPFFKLRRARKCPEPLFPLAHLQQASSTTSVTGSSTSLGVEGTPRPASANSAGTPRELHHNGHASHLTAAAALYPSNGGNSGHSSPTQPNTMLRGRSSTMSSLGRESADDHPASLSPQGSSIGRKSFGDLLGLNRLRQPSDANRQGGFTPVTPGSVASKSGSLQLPRESVTLPERLEDETPAKYLARIEGVISRGIVAAALSKGSDAFSTAALRSCMRTFSFFGDPMDMSLRKLLMEAELPKETQQIDRFLQAFANRYHECNPGIYASPDQAYFIAFSLLILHTDVFNKNNKHKMQKPDYLKNTRGEGIFDDILECFYDNICYTPFIHMEDELELGSERAFGSRGRRKTLLTGAGSSDQARRAAKEPIDPYTLIIEGNIDLLRPNLKDTMPLEDHYNYLGSAQSLNLKDLQKTFFKTGVLQIVSARSRPDAFMSDKSAGDPLDTGPGIVDIKVTKVGLLWRKDVKKRKTRSPWQEWGAILTGAQLYFFRNTSWVKNLMHQYDAHIKAGHDGIPLTFKPPLEEFKPDALMSTDGAVALLDMSYKKHKNALVYVTQGGLHEVLLADDEHELNDWLAKLNYAAAFRTSGVRMRGVVGGNYDGQGRRGFRRLDSSDATQLIQTPTGPVAIARSRIDHKMAEDIQSARRDVMRQKIAEADLRIDESRKALEVQLQNARHLQILAPIQPRTREQLLSAAARMSAQLRWTRVDIWREKCHRDILALDLEEDPSLPRIPESDDARQPRNIETGVDPMQRLSLVSQDEPEANLEEILDISPHRRVDHRLSLISIPPQAVPDRHRTPTSPTRPSSAPRPEGGSFDLAGMKSAVARHGSVSSITASSTQSPITGVQKPQDEYFDGDGLQGTSKPEDAHDDVDAEERQFLRQSGLLQGRLGRDPTDKITTSSSADAMEQVVSGERDKLDRAKVRRSFQRTLRESAGHLSHHRSKKGRDTNPPLSSEDSVRDSTLSRGTGSFVVHGKKASVVHLAPELQIMTTEDPILARKSLPQIPSSLSDQLPASPVLGGAANEDPDPSAETLTAFQDPFERRESTASASTATARSFRDLHRKYSSVQAARSVSAAGRLTVPSDCDSDAAASFSEGRRSPLPPGDNRGKEDGDMSAAVPLEGEDHASRPGEDLAEAHELDFEFDQGPEEADAAEESMPPPQPDAGEQEVVEPRKA